GLRDGSAQVTVRQVGGDQGHALLRHAPYLRGAPRHLHRRDGLQRHRALRGGVDDELADLVDARVASVHAAYEHVDFLVTPGVAGGELSAHVRHDAIRDVTDREAQLRRAFLVEDDLDLRVAGLDRGLQVGESAGGGHRRHDPPVDVGERIEVVTRDLDRERAREGHQGGALELVLDARHARQRVPEPGHHGFLFGAAGPGPERHVERARVLAGFHRVRIQPVAGARHGVGEFDRVNVFGRAMRRTHDAVGFDERRAGREAQVHAELALRELRDQLRAQSRHEQHRAAEGEYGDTDDYGAVCEG